MPSGKGWASVTPEGRRNTAPAFWSSGAHARRGVPPLLRDPDLRSRRDHPCAGRLARGAPAAGLHRRRRARRGHPGRAGARARRVSAGAPVAAAPKLRQGRGGDARSAPGRRRRHATRPADRRRRPARCARRAALHRARRGAAGCGDLRAGAVRRLGAESALLRPLPHAFLSMDRDAVLRRQGFDVRIPRLSARRGGRADRPGRAAATHGLRHRRARAPRLARRSRREHSDAGRLPPWRDIAFPHAARQPAAHAHACAARERHARAPSAAARAQAAPAPAMSDWSRLVERGSPLGIRIVAACYRLMGERAARLLLYPVVGYFLLTGSAARRASQDYFARLQRFAGEGGRTPPPGWATSFRHMMAFAESALHKLAAWMGRGDTLNVDFPDRARFDALLASGKGALLVGAHLGNLEMARALAAEWRLATVNAVVYSEHARAVRHALEAANAQFADNLIHVGRAHL